MISMFWDMDVCGFDLQFKTMCVIDLKLRRACNKFQWRVINDNVFGVYGAKAYWKVVCVWNCVVCST